MTTSALKPVSMHGAVSWRFASNLVEAWLTKDGGHLAPVKFKLGRDIVQPYAIAPWHPNEVNPPAPKVLRSLRGDFFCCPFGNNARAWRGERHPVHGETATASWHFVSLQRDDVRTALTTCIETKVRRGQVTKTIELRAGETNVYCRHVLSGYRGRVCLGHHAMLRFSGRDNSGLIAVAPFKRGQVLPQTFEQPADGGYQSLRVGACFSSLNRVPLAAGGFADLSSFPSRRGFDDLVMVSAHACPIAWTAVSFPGERFLWFALKDPCVLPSTLLWSSNGGRHYAPWNGRHHGVLGLEEIVAFFDRGLAASARPNRFTRAGIPTAVVLFPNAPFVVNYIMGVVSIPPGFGRVTSITVLTGRVNFFDHTGQAVETRVDWGFLGSSLG